ncbi:unnamed protein product [uncultured bacterium]|nr:unnamed protein product [uncultured bacterium]
MFKIPIFKEKTKPVVERCQTDPTTKLRLKYSPYYQVIEKAVGVDVVIHGRKMVLMSTNEYLGLSQHPKVIEAARQAALQWGTSPCGSRLANGSRAYHIELEETLAQFLNQEACHVTVAGYLACVASVSLAQRGDALVVDKNIHASLWEGARLCGADIERFTHGDMDSLEQVLRGLEPEQPKVLAVDGVYSMEGHIAPMKEIVRLANEHNAFLVVDDAHGLGVLGKDGRGVADHFGVTNEVDLVCGSFSKSLASTGGFLAGKRATIEYLRSNSRQIIFSAAITPPAAAAALASIKVMQAEPEHRERVWANTRYFRGLLDSLGIDYWNSETPAIPIVIGNKERAYFVWKALQDRGFFTVMAVSPGVPPGKDLIRTAISALHTTEQLDQFGDALKSVLKKAGVKPR